MKKVYAYLQGARGILLIVYMMFILCTDISISSLSPIVKWLLCFVTLAVLVALCPLMFRGLKRFSLRHKDILTSREKRIRWFLAFFLISLLVIGIYYIAFYPGGFSSDSIDQYKEATTGKYNDWHPVIQTLFSFTLPLTLTGGWIGSIILFQTLLLSAAIGYGAYTILRHSNLTFAVLYLIFVLINPVTESMSMYPWKDVPFAIAAVLTAAFAANTYFTKGEWLKIRRNHIAAVVVLVLGTLFRHNAIFFTLPMLIAMLFYLNRKAVIITAACFLSALFLVKVPLFAVMGVERSRGRVCETMGAAMTVLGEVAKRNPDAMSDDMRDFMYRVAPKGTWDDIYQTGSFNSVKFAYGTDYLRIDEEGPFKVLGYTISSFFRSPKEAFTALISLTDMVYTITGAIDWMNISPAVTDNDVGIAYSGSEDIKSAISYVILKDGFWFNNFYWYIGLSNLALIACALAKLRTGKKDLKRLFMTLSVLCYNFGTMLLLSGNDFRFFYYTFLTTPLVLLILLREDRENVQEAPENKKKKQRVRKNQSIDSV